MLCVMYALTRSLFEVGFEWLRLGLLCVIFSGVAVSGEILLPTHGFSGLLLRALWLTLAPALLFLTRFFSSQEMAHAVRFWQALRQYLRRASGGGQA
jgi:hypothetical protein